MFARMGKKLRGFARLSAGEKALFLEAWVTLGVMQAAILTLSFKRLTRGLRQSSGAEAPPELSDAQRAEAERIGRAILRAAAHTPWESACLAQVLTARQMLQRRGIPGAFWLGAAKGGEGDPEMEAHAWTRCGDLFVTGRAGHERYTPLSAFGWEGER